MAQGPSSLGLKDWTVCTTYVFAHVNAEKRPQFLVSYLQKYSVPHLVCLFRGFPECPHLLAAGFPRGSGPRWSKEEAMLLFPTWLQKSQAALKAATFYVLEASH